MIRTPRHRPAPAELVRRQAQWTRRYKERRRADWATARAKEILRRALRGLAHGKCVYCESRLGKDTNLEIEHYIAKTVDPDRAFEWANLFPACRLCNQAKGDVDHAGLLLKSDDEDPEPYFWLDPEGNLEPHPSLDSDELQKRRAELTIQLCDLKRGGLQVSRYETMKLVSLLLDQASTESLEFLLAPQREYKFVIRHMFKVLGCPDLAQEDRRRFEAPLGS